MTIELLPLPLYVRKPNGQRDRIYGPTGPQRHQLRLEVFVRDAFTCHLCGLVFEVEPGWSGQGVPGLTLGHIIAYRDGGPYVPENLRAECLPCNHAEAPRTPPGTPETSIPGPSVICVDY